ncbi:hypothetical protein ES708_33501 [subsurface metagenome]
MASPLLSLFKLTLPLITGVSNARQASLIPLTDSSSCQNISFFSGFPKLRLSVTAIGKAPLQERLRAASATAISPPTKGSR